MGLLGTIGGLAGGYFGGSSGGALGGALGGLLDGNEETKGGAGTQSKAPWAPAQPYLLDNLKTNADMQKFYQQNPFNSQQKQSFENIFSDLNNFRNTTAPGLMDFANSAMTRSYQRPQYSRPGDAGYGPRQSAQSPQRAPFQVGQGNITMPSWDAQNPHSAQNAPPPPPPPPPPNPVANVPIGLGYNGGGGNFGGYANGNGYNGSNGGLFGNVNDGFNAIQGAINTPAGAGAAYAASLLGLLGYGKQDPTNVPVVDLSTYGWSPSSLADYGWSPSFGDYGNADSPGGSDMGGYGGADNGY